MRGIFRQLPREERRPSRMLSLIRRRPPRLPEDESEFSRRTGQTIGGIWMVIKLLLLLPLLVLVILGVVILILKIVSTVGALL